MIHACRVSTTATLLLFVLCSVAAGQVKQSPAPDVVLSVKGEVARELKLTLADIAKLPRRIVRAKDHDGKEAAYEGVEISEVLKLAGAPSGEELRGKNLALFLVVDAADGYRAVFALPELDRAFTEQRVILLADRRDGKALSKDDGRLRIVVPDEKRHGRWVRQVVSLTIRRS